MNAQATFVVHNEGKARAARLIREPEDLPNEAVLRNPMAKGFGGQRGSAETLLRSEDVMRMQCAMVRRVGSISIETVDVRRPQADEVLVRVAVAGVCRTDLKIVRFGHRDLTLPRIPAEEVVGTVVETGSGVHDAQVGERVYIYPGKWCGQCPTCQSGAHNLCRDMEIMGFHRHGGFAEFVTVPSQSIIKLPASLAFEDAVFAEPLSCCLNALQLAQLRPAETVGIWGAGPAGTLLGRAAMTMQAQSFHFEPQTQRRRAVRQQLPADHHRFDVCVVAVGSTAAYREALAKLTPRGRLVVFSGLAPKADTVPISLNQLHYQEQSLIDAYGCCHQHGVSAVELLASGAVKVNDLISHRLPLNQIEDALMTVEEKMGMKVLLHPNNCAGSGQ